MLSFLLIFFLFVIFFVWINFNVCKIFKSISFNSIVLNISFFFDFYFCQHNFLSWTNIIVMIFITMSTKTKCFWFKIENFIVFFLFNNEIFLLSLFIDRNWKKFIDRNWTKIEKRKNEKRFSIIIQNFLNFIDRKNESWINRLINC